MSFIIPSRSSSGKILIQQNKLEYEEMKRRLLETEQKLQKLSKLEEEVQSVVSETSDRISSVSEHRARFYKHQDENESVPSAISTVPESYTWFANHNMQSSTPSKQKRATLPTEEDDCCESDNSSNSANKNTASNKYERKLLCQNQRLLVEVERLVSELHTAKQEVAALRKYEDAVKGIPDLEDKMEGLIAENKAQDKALREAEKLLDEGARRNADLQTRLEKFEGDVTDLRMELKDLKATRRELEKQRDEALQNLMEAQDSLEDYQRRMKEKMKKMEAVEDELRDQLASTTQERDDIMEQLSDMQTSLASQEAQINRLLNDLEMEESKRRDEEQEKKQLHEQLEMMTAQLSKCEKELKEVNSVRKEKTLLEAELSEHRVMAQEIADLLMLVQHNHNKNVLNDSGNYSIHTAKNELKVGPVDAGDTVAGLNTNNNGNVEEEEGYTNDSGNLALLNTNNNGLGCEGSTTMMGELRNLFTNMDGEIQRLRYDLKQRDADDRTYQNLHDELKVLMDKVESGVRANQELECLVASLEEDRKNLSIKLDECQHTVAERERQIQCLDTRLNERNHQVVCLQEDCNQKAQQICHMEKELDGAERRLRMSQAGSSQNGEQLSAAESRIKELEEILAMKECNIQELNDQISKLNKDMRLLQQKFEKKIDCLTQQVYEYQKQTDQLLSDNETLRHKLAVCTKASDECKRCLHAREDQIRCLETQVEELKCTLDEKDKLHSKVLESYQQKICKSNEQIKNLECALMMCKNEVQMHLETMEKIKAHFESELANRDSCIKHLKEELRKCGEELKCRVDENCSLEQTNADLSAKLSNSYCVLRNCEQNVCCLTEKLKNAENQMLKDKACYMKETEELERRLSQALNNLQCAHEEINKLKNALSEKAGIVDCLQGEKNSLCRDLAKCKEVACTLQDKLSKMEKDNQELCRQLQQKMDCIRDLENAVCSKEQELKCCQRCVDELQEKIKCLQFSSGSNACTSIQEKLKSCREELLCQSKMLCECEEALKRCQMELRDKCEEIRLLNCTVEELNCKLHERIARVDELEKAIENLNRDIEKRMKRVDEQLKKYECELSDKSKQIADLDDCLSRCQHNLNEKCNEACVLEQKNTRLCSDLNCCNSKLKESEETRECLGKVLSEQRAENAELAQELRVTREQIQQKHQELVECQQSLCSCNREWERCRRECDDLRNTLTQRECELQHLNEEKNCLVSKVAHLTCRLENETCQLQNQMAEMKCRLEKENEALRVYQGEIEENNACLMQKLAAYQRQLSQVEKCCHQKLDSMNREIEDLNSKLADREDQIAQCKECLTLKDSEIMRLKLRLCSTERDACSSNRCSNNNTSLDLDSSWTGRYRLDDIGKPLLIDISQTQDGRDTARHKGAPDQTVDQLNNAENKHRRKVTENGETTTASNAQDSKEESLHDSQKRTQKDQVGDSSSSPRNSIGVSEVQERLRSNEIRQKEIERELQSLEENAELESQPVNIYDVGRQF